MRMGKKKQPTYRVVVADARSPRDGRFVEIIGKYGPGKSRPSSTSTTSGTGVAPEGGPAHGAGAAAADDLRSLGAAQGWPDVTSDDEFGVDSSDDFDDDDDLDLSMEDDVDGRGRGRRDRRGGEPHRGWPAQGRAGVRRPQHRGRPRRCLRGDVGTPGGDVELRLHVSPADMGKVIGRRGRVAQALRQVVAAAGTKEGVRASLDIVD